MHVRNYEFVSMKFVVKNMVCSHCINAVRTVLLSEAYTIKSIQLGDVEIEEELTDEQKAELNRRMKELGFEILDDPRSQLVEQLRVAIQAWARMHGSRPKISEYLSSQFCRDYSILSKLFTQVRGITIEKYSILHRIEYAKELLCYNQMTISEISYILDYSSPAHFSRNFKETTGMSPKQFREQNTHDRKMLTEL